MLTNPADGPRRLCVVMMSADALARNHVQGARQSATTTTCGVPADAELMHFTTDGCFNVLFVYEHPSFAEVAPNAVIPLHTLTVTDMEARLPQMSAMYAAI